MYLSLTFEAGEESKSQICRLGRVLWHLEEDRLKWEQTKCKSTNLVVPIACEENNNEDVKDG